jgi:hypothetical protein
MPREQAEALGLKLEISRSLLRVGRLEVVLLLTKFLQSVVSSGASVASARISSTFVKAVRLSINARVRVPSGKLGRLGTALLSCSCSPSSFVRTAPQMLESLSKISRP